MFSSKNEEYLMEILAFNIRGKFAHFRKFYSNSSALSYFIPPRTTIIGLIAGMLGLERDSYYEDFSLDNCDTGVRGHHGHRVRLHQCDAGPVLRGRISLGLFRAWHAGAALRPAVSG